MPKMTIEQFKEQYPQYRDEPSTVLAKNLYDKFYSDVPYKSYLETVMPEDEDETFFTLDEGVDYSAAFGPQTKIKTALSGIGEGVADIAGYKQEFMPEKRKAIADIKALNTYATTRLMQTLAGKENVQLQERLQALTATPAKFESPSTAASTIKAYLGFLDFSESATQNLLDSGLLDEKQSIKGRQDLKAIQNMRNEYLKIDKQFDRSFGRDQETENKLERFYRD